MSQFTSCLRTLRRCALGLLGALPLLAAGAQPAIVDLMTGGAANVASAVPARGFAGSAVEGVFNAAALGAGRLRVDVGGGRQLVAVMTRETRGNRGDRSWVGEFEGAPGSLLTLTAYRGSVHGFLHHGADTWEIESRPNGRLQLFRVDERKLPAEGTPRKMPAGDATGSVAPLGTVAPEATAAEPVVQDMMVVYTAQAASAALAAGTHIETRILNAVAAANAAYAASGVNIQMNLVHTAQVAYTETGDMGVSLDRVTGTADGFMDDVHALRNQFGADLVGLITNESNYCGIAWVNSSAAYAFSVTWWNCFAGQTFAHEVGHNQGNLHDRLNSGSGGAYPYSYGYRTCDHPTLANGQSFRTVMAYSCTGVPRVNYFSNPGLLYNGAQMGIAYEVDAANAADNTRSMNNTAAITAGLRAPPATLPATPTNLGGTAASATQINLAWTDNATDETGYNVERATGSGTYAVVATLGANTTGYANTGLASATTYSYRVRALNSAGFSQYSNVVTVTTPMSPAPSIPAAPGNPTVSLAGRIATVRWSDVADETSYQLVRELLNTKNNTWGATTLNLAQNTVSRAETLSRGKTYRYKVRATNAAGSSAYVLVSCAGIAGCTNTSQFKVP